MPYDSFSFLWVTQLIRSHYNRMKYEHISTVINTVA